MTLVDVRQVSASEWPDVRVVRLAALADAPDAFITRLVDAEVEPEQLWRDRVSTNPHLLARVDGRPVGMAVLLLTAMTDAAPQVVGVWVDPAVRGRGVLEGLLDGVVAAAQAAGLRELRLWVVDGNRRAERAYSRYGFARTGEVQPVPGRPGDVEVEMAYRLRGAGGTGR